MGAFRITVGKERLGFAAAHFITFADGTPEPLHGHDYRVAVTLSARVNEAGYVADFVTLEEAARRSLAALDHRVLLPTRSPLVEVTETEGRVTARCGERRWEFPAEEVRLLPLSNTTAERLAEHLATELAHHLGEAGLATPPFHLELEVEESPGHSARYVTERSG